MLFGGKGKLAGSYWRQAITTFPVERLVMHPIQECVKCGMSCSVPLD